MYSDRLLRWLFLIGLWVLAEVLGYYGLKRLGLWRRWLGWSTAIAFLLGTVLFGAGYLLQTRPGGHTLYLSIQRAGGVLFLVWLGLTMGKLLGGVWGLLAGRQKTPKAGFSPSRRAFLQTVGAAAAALPCVGLGYGFWIGRYRFRFETIEVALPDLPPAWEGLSILQFSDLHSGSFVEPAALKPVWEAIQKAAADLCVFTGDWVNVYAEELEPFVADLASLSAPLGKWAVLGNHDYGDYARWKDPTEKAANLAYLRRLIAQSGFRLLEDAAYTLYQGGEPLTLVGVGNWSAWRRFQRYGDLARAWKDVPSQGPKILLSHDPTHWEAQVQGRYPISLTLSGHTHGLQFGLEWGRWRFSPAQWLYTYWAGLYQVGSQFLYVNRGLGYVGVPARLGIWPEVTILRLRRQRPV